MEKRIQLERRGRKEAQISELNLDNCKSTHIVGLSDEYTSLETLSLINVGLTTLKGFPKLPKLKTLELSDNRISNGLTYLETSPNLVYLNLSGNKIKDLDELKPLNYFKSLSVLDLFNNEATSVENYREKIFAMLPSLKYLDGFDCNDVEAPSEGDDDDEGDDDEGEEANGADSDDESDDYYDEEEEDNGEMSLAQVYKEDLDDDSSDFEVGEEEDEDEDIDDEEEENGVDDKNTSTTSTAEEPAQQARGKKRKHDG
ncbi:ANP32A family protein [Megaselia abdita]